MTNMPLPGFNRVRSRQSRERDQELKNLDDLDVGIGGKQNAQKRIPRLEEDLEHQQTMQARYSVAQKVVKYGAIGIGLGELSNIVRDIVREIVGTK